MLKKMILGLVRPECSSQLAETNVSKGTSNSKLFLIKFFYDGPILRYIFALQKHSGRTVLHNIELALLNHPSKADI